jgi:hypothetical protein
LEIGLPHAAQNFLPLLLSVPHFEQRIDPTPPQSNAILYHQRPLADIADSGAVEPKVQGLLKVIADDQANPEPSLIAFERASQPWSTGPGVTASASSYCVATDKL